MVSKSTTYDSFENLITLLQNKGFSSEAKSLQVIINQTAWTTSSELLGEVGLELKKMKQSKNFEKSKEIMFCFNECVNIVRLAWPEFSP